MRYNPPSKLPPDILILTLHTKIVDPVYQLLTNHHTVKIIQTVIPVLIGNILVILDVLHIH